MSCLVRDFNFNILLRSVSEDLRRTRSVQYLFVWVYRKGCLRFYLISSSANHGIRAVNFQRRELLKITHHTRVLRLMGLDACAVVLGRRFVTERTRKKKESRNLNPDHSAWVITLRTYSFDQIIISTCMISIHSLSCRGISVGDC